MAISSFFNISVCAEALALLAALLILTGKGFAFWRWFAVFLTATILAEFGGFYIRNVLVRPNYPVYNFLMLMQAVFYSFLFFQFLNSKQKRLWVVIGLAFFVLFFITEGITRNFLAYQKYSRQFLSVFVVLFSCLFFFSMLKNDISQYPVKYAPFWVVTGLFFYYFGSVAMFAFYDKVSKIKLSGNVSFYSLIMGCLSCILYGTWIVGFVLKKRETQ